MSTTIEKFKVFGTHESKTLQQMETLIKYGSVAGAALLSDGHLGYSQPIGGVIAYRDEISPSGVGYDIACGNKAVKTSLTYGDIKNDLSRLADEIFKNIEFGVGRSKQKVVDHAIFDRDNDAWSVRPEIMSLKRKAQSQLGTIGSGNHYVDLFVEQDVPMGLGTTEFGYSDSSPIWVGVHFGSRGLGHNIATGFLKLASGLGWADKPPKGERYEKEEPTLLSLDSDLGQDYLIAMGLAGDYAYAGRDVVVDEVLSILDSEAVYSVHNHHNFAWLENHGGEDVWVIRKGATPNQKGQQGFIGGSMCDISVIIEGTGIEDGSFDSTVHGSGRVMGRMEAKGKKCRRCKGQGCESDAVVGPSDPQPCDGSGWTRQPRVKFDDWRQKVRDYGIELRGAGVDESPFVYRKLSDVLANHSASTRVLHTLRPIVVCMAGPEVRDPWRD